MDCWTNSIESIPIARRIGYDPNVGPGGRSRFAQGGGFDVVSMMFCMHYAFETEAKCRNMLKNVAGSLKTGGRFIGTIPSSDIISQRVRGTDSCDKLPEDEEHGVQEWGNSIYRIKFSKPPPRAGTFRPMWGWEYNFFLEEAVEEVPEYVVPWEAFRGIAEDYGLELEYKKLFHDVWREEKNNAELKLLSERMGVIRRDNGEFALGDDEWEACGEC
jgi:mRNA (guanine-N7-)-methyltransferase